MTPHADPVDAPRTYTVGELAKLANVTVRALHHYDEIGLLTPSDRTPAGYRVYGRDDLEALQQILLFKELDFPLEDIRRILGDPLFDRRAALNAQRDHLVEKARRNAAILAAVDATLATIRKGTTMRDEEMFEVFGSFDAAAHRTEADDRWAARGNRAWPTPRGASSDERDTGLGGRFDPADPPARHAGSREDRDDRVRLIGGNGGEQAT